jgi:charged multivesicular body protein 1
MGKEQSKPAPKMDMTDMLINMKMKSKMFSREHNKAMKDKKKQLAKAKACLKKGEEEGARLYCDLAQQKHSEAMQYLRMSHRLEVIAGQVKSKSKSMEMMDSLNQFTPFLQEASANMPLEQMYKNMEEFSTAYDDLAVKGHIMDENMNKVMGDKGTVENVDNMMNQLKAEVAFDMTGDVNTNDATQNMEKQADTQPADQNQDFYAQLKNL